MSTYKYLCVNIIGIYGNFLSVCHEEKHPKMPGHHTSAYEEGWMMAYSDVTGEASNDNGTYGNNCKKHH
ncbi:MAG: hypothetical protein WBE68_18470 [Candidatus Nitrosopolaris sp.]